MPRGGNRNGTPGKAYANRTDMGGQNVVQAQLGNQPGAKLAVQAATGQQYGAAAAQKASQSAVPMAGSPQNIQSPPSAPTTPHPNPPGSFGDLTDPSQRPGENLMTGVNAGPGAGSEALAPILPTTPQMSALGLLNSLGSNISPQVAALRAYLNSQAQNEMPH